MAITVDDSFARFTGTPADNVALTSGSFTPASGAMLVVCVNLDQNTGNSNNQTITVSSTGGGASGWAQRAKRNGADSSNHGAAYIWTATGCDGSSMTVSVTRTSATDCTSGRTSVKVYIITGHHASPIGTTGSGSHNADPAGAFALFTATGAGRAIYCITEWAEIQTVASTDTISAANYAGTMNVASMYRTSDHSSGTVNGNVTYGGTPAANWVAFEVLAAAGGTPTYAPSNTVRPRILTPFATARQRF